MNCGLRMKWNEMILVVMSAINEIMNKTWNIFNSSMGFEPMMCCALLYVAHSQSFFFLYSGVIRFYQWHQSIVKKNKIYQYM